MFYTFTYWFFFSLQLWLKHCMRALVILYLFQYLVLSLTWILFILEVVQWHFLVILICISQMTNHVEHFFICLLATCKSPLVKSLFSSLLIVIGLFVLLLICNHYLYSLLMSSLSVICIINIFSQSMTGLFLS